MDLSVAFYLFTDIVKKKKEKLPQPCKQATPLCVMYDDDDDGKERKKETG